MGLVLLTNSCKQKGCTNKSALNYNITAQDDDGSCIYCTTTITQAGSISTFLIDNNSTSPHFNQAVAVFNLSEVSKGYNYQSCGSDSCIVSLSIQNLVGQEIVFDYTLFTNFGEVFGFSDIGASQTTRDSVLQQFSTSSISCTQLNNASVSTNGTITYH